MLILIVLTTPKSLTLTRTNHYTYLSLSLSSHRSILFSIISARLFSPLSIYLKRSFAFLCPQGFQFISTVTPRFQIAFNPRGVQHFLPC
ncbi:unnamed protein product [Ilex paraguariensis]|uniref:Uncharacterized protein n=1 Tax=Ilex paraguariensis TaxID=185542 RepID=A0ABC8SEF5_9AQUA